MTGLWVAELSLSHFRSHRRTSLALDPRPVVLYGPNGAGKTNLLEAVSLLSPGRGLRRAAAEDLSRRPEAIGWKIEAAIGTGRGYREVVLRAEPGQSRDVRLDGKTAAQVALGRVVPMVWLVPAMDRLWTEGADGRRRFLDRVAMSFRPEHADAVLSYEKAMRERNRLLKEEARDRRWYDAIEAQMAAAGEAVTANRRHAVGRLAQAQEGAATVFPAAELGLTHPDRELPEDLEGLAAALAESRGRDLRAGRTLVGPHRVDLTATWAAKGVAAAQCSTGEQKALLISLVLSNARALAASGGAAPVILLDEVAAHLDPSRRDALYDEIAALGAQAWMTGTDAGLFTGLGARARHFEVTEERGESRVMEREAP